MALAVRGRLNQKTAASPEHDVAHERSRMILHIHIANTAETCYTLDFVQFLHSCPKV